MESQSMIFLLAGFETTSASLAFLSYQLALNPDVQDKLRNEVDEHFPDVKQVIQNTAQPKTKTITKSWIR